jgi:hypothetical protein
MYRLQIVSLWASQLSSFAMPRTEFLDKAADMGLFASARKNVGSPLTVWGELVELIDNASLVGWL